jgi:hypothetical protein
MILEDVLTASGNPNVYNTGTFNLPNDGTTVNFLNDPHIQEMLHVRGSDIPGMRMQMAEDGCYTYTQISVRVRVPNESRTRTPTNHYRY